MNGRKLGLLSLVGTIYCLVSGGPYGLEEILGAAGWRGAIVILVVTPLVWSVPTALVVAELSSALPDEGGYYAWVRRGLGPFWGFQEAWLSLAASVFDMALYPTLFATYIGWLRPELVAGHGGTVLGAAMIAVATTLNLRGAKAVGDASVGLTAAILVPFVALSILAFTSGAPGPSVVSPAHGVGAAFFVALWNYMGWDNASTIASEVDDPGRTYPRALLLAVALVALTYVAPVAAVGVSGVADRHTWATGSWTGVAFGVGGRPLGVAMALGGAVSAFAMFDALVLSYSRVPVALARDGLFPRVLGKRDPVTDVPAPAVLACALVWTLCLGLGFDRLVAMDVVLYGLSLVLEVVALAALRLREPDLPRPFRVPLGLFGLVACAAAPTAIVAAAAIHVAQEAEGRRGLLLAAGVAAVGPVAWLVARRRAASAPQG